MRIEPAEACLFRRRTVTTLIGCHDDARSIECEEAMLAASNVDGID